MSLDLSALFAKLRENASGDHLKEEEELFGESVTLIVRFADPPRDVRAVRRMGESVQTVKRYLLDNFDIPYESYRLFIGDTLMLDPLSLNDFPAVRPGSDVVLEARSTAVLAAGQEPVPLPLGRFAPAAAAAAASAPRGAAAAGADLHMNGQAGAARAAVAAGALPQELPTEHEPHVDMRNSTPGAERYDLPPHVVARATATLPKKMDAVDVAEFANYLHPVRVRVVGSGDDPTPLVPDMERSRGETVAQLRVAIARALSRPPQRIRLGAGGVELLDPLSLLDVPGVRATSDAGDAPFVVRCQVLSIPTYSAAAPVVAAAHRPAASRKPCAIQ